MTDRPAAPDRPAPLIPAPREAVQRWRLVLARDAEPSDAPQRAHLSSWEEALRESGLPVAGLDAVPPKPRMAMAAPLAAGVPGEAELVDVWLVERLARWRVREALEERVPPGTRLLDVQDVWLGEPTLPGQVVASVYRAEFEPGVADRADLDGVAIALLAAATLPRIRRKGDKAVSYDLRPFVDAIEVLEPPPDGRTSVRMVLRHDPERGIGRPEELLAELGERLGMALVPSILLRERLVLVSERQASRGQGAGGPGPARGPGPGKPRRR